MQANWAWLIAALVAIAGVCTTLWVNKQRSRKALSYRVVSDVEFIHRVPGAPQDLRVLYHGVEVQTVSMLVIEFKNTGAVPITPSDWVEPLTLELPKGGEIFHAAVARHFPPNFEPEIEVTDMWLRLKPTLMNPGDRLEIGMFTPLPEGTLPKMRYRISGVSAISKQSPRSVPLIEPLMLVTTLGLLIASISTAARGVGSREALLAKEYLKTHKSLPPDPGVAPVYIVTMFAVVAVLLGSIMSSMAGFRRILRER